MSIDNSNILKTANLNDNAPVLNTILDYKTTDRINSILMFNLSKNSIIYQNEICLNFYAFNCNKEAIIINVTGQEALASWTLYFKDRLYIFIFNFRLLIFISEIDFLNETDKRDHCISFARSSNLNRRNDSKIIDYFTINTNFNVSTNEFYIKKDVHPTINIKITPNLYNAIIPTVINEVKPRIKKNFREDLPLKVFPQVVLIDNPNIFCCKLQINNTTSNGEEIMYTNTYPMSEWIIDMKLGNYKKTFNPPPNDKLSTSSTNQYKRSKIEDL